ncbi:MAG: hypothetical protein K0S56_522 [Microvirga sp.]|jgi:hypothetical protein|nr:hypothetical protein [Microvirga sp.]
MIFLAPGLDDLKRIALDAVDGLAAEKLARPAPGMDALKLAEALQVARGVHSRLISAEAGINGISDEDQARRVIAAANATIDIELDRVEAKAAIRAASAHATVLAVLKNRGIALHPGPSLGL